jgi:RNA polymerase sigma factor (sigma-70 family)
MKARFPDSEATDQSLVEEYLCGDDNAGSTLCMRYTDSIWRFAYHHTGGNRERADDVCQETFARFVRYLKENHFQAENGGVRKFLYTVAHNLIQDARRQQSHRPIDTVHGARAARTAPLQNAILAEEADRLVEAVSGLSKPEQHVLIEYYWNSKTLRAIGSDLGMSETTVWRMLKDIHEHLRQKIDRGA